MNLFFAFIMTLLSAAGGCREDTPQDNALLGKFAMAQTCDGATNPGYTLEVRSVANEPDQRTLVNLGGYGQRVPATVQGDSLTIILTKVNTGLTGQVELSGTGTRRDGELYIQLNVQVPGPQGSTTTSRCELRGTPMDTF